MSDTWEKPHWVVEKEQRVEKARGPFKELVLDRLGVDRGELFGPRRAPAVVGKLEAALRALREWRDANGQQRRHADEIDLAIRVVCEAMATAIGEAAGAREHPETIAWVIAGLRCPSRPFCRGCDACFTIDAPHRHDVEIPVQGGTISR